MSKKSSPRRQTLSFFPGSSQTPLFSPPKRSQRSRASLAPSRSILKGANDNNTVIGVMKVPNTRQSMNKRRVSFAPEATLHTFELVESAAFVGSQMPQPARTRDSAVNKELASIFSSAAAAASNSSLDGNQAPSTYEQEPSQNENESANNQPNDTFHTNEEESDMELESTADIFAATKATIQEYEARDGSPKPAGSTVTTSIPTSTSIENFADGLGDSSRRESNTQQSEVEASEIELSHQEDHSQKIQSTEEHTMDMTQMFGSVKTRVELESQVITTEGQVDHVTTEEHTMELTNVQTVPSVINDDAADIDFTGNASVPAEEEMDFTNVVNAKLPSEENGEQEMELTTVLTKQTNNEEEEDMDFTTIPSKPVVSDTHNSTNGSGGDDDEQDMDFTTVPTKTVQPVSIDNKEQDMDLTNFPVTTTEPNKPEDNEEQDMDLTTISASYRQTSQDEEEEADMDFTTIQKTSVIPVAYATDDDEDGDEEDMDLTTIQKVSEEDDMDFTNISRPNDDDTDMNLTNVLELAAQDDLSELLNPSVTNKPTTPQKQLSPKQSLVSNLQTVSTPERNTKENRTPNGSALRNQTPNGITPKTTHSSSTKRKISLSLRPLNFASTFSPAQRSKSAPSTPSRTTVVSGTPQKRTASYSSVNVGNKKRRLSVSTTPERSRSSLSLTEPQPPLTPSKTKLIENKIVAMSPHKTHSRRTQPLERSGLPSTSFATVEPYMSDTFTQAVTYTPLSRMRKDSFGIAAPRLPLASMSPTPKKGMENNYTVLSRVSEGDEEEMGELKEMDQYPLVSLTDFLKSIKVEFMDNLFLNNSSLYDSPVLFTADDNSEAPSWQLGDYVYATTKIPRLEMYIFSIHEMRKNIADARLMFEQVDQETQEGANPLVFREFLEAGPEMKQMMITQFKLTKHYSRVQVRGLWYEWRLKLTAGVQEGLTRRRQIVEDDSLLLGDRARATNMAALKARVTQEHSALKARLEVLRQQTAELDKYDKAQMDAVRKELLTAKHGYKDATARVEQQQARVAELGSQLVEVNAERDALEHQIEDFRQIIARNQTDERDLRREVGVLTRRYKVLQAHSGVDFVSTGAAVKSEIVLKVGTRFLVHYDIKAQKTVSVKREITSSDKAVSPANSISCANEDTILAYFFANPALREYSLQQTAAYLQAVVLFQKNIEKLSLYYRTTVTLGLEGSKDKNALFITVKILHYPNSSAGAVQVFPQPPTRKVIVKVSITDYNPTAFSSCTLQTCYPRPDSKAIINGGVSGQLTDRLNRVFGGPDPTQFLSFFVQSTT